jgi:hypothetical protein
MWSDLSMSAVFTRAHLDRGEGKIHFERVQDVEPIIARNKALQSVAQSSDWARHVASIPNVILEKWMNEEGVNYLALPVGEFARLIRRKLADPDWRWLRVDK